MAEIISGKIVSEKIRSEIREEVVKYIDKTGRTPGLAVILVGENPASVVYVRNKHKTCMEVGINSFEYNLPADASEAELISLIESLNSDEKVDGILVQLPLPSHIDEEKVINSISADKDVDAFSPSNVGRILIGEYSFLPCTPSGVMELIDYYHIDLEGKNCVVIGRSNIVGKPMALLLLERNATVTVCHSRTRNLSEYTTKADLVVVAVGREGFLKADMIKPGAVVIDVGINRNKEGRLCGDVDFDSVEPIASYITPVPGGVGPMTITMLMKNTVSAAKMHSYQK